MNINLPDLMKNIIFVNPMSQSDIIEATIKEAKYDQNILGAKFKIGEHVHVNHNGNSFNSYIIGMCPVDYTDIEYYVKGYGWALWEEDIQKRNLQKTCTYCKTEQALENSHCISCGAVIFE